MRNVIASGARRGPGAATQLVLPTRNGRDELLNHCFQVVGSGPNTDYLIQIATLVRANTYGEEAVGLWLTHAGRAEGPARTKWLEFGLYLGALARISPEALGELLYDTTLDDYRARLLMRGRCWQYIAETEHAFRACLDALLDRDINTFTLRRTGPQTILEQLSAALSTVSLAYMLPQVDPLPFARLLGGTVYSIWTTNGRHLCRNSKLPNIVSA